MDIGLKTLAYLVCPDLLGYNGYGHFLTVELKVTSGNKIKFSPHQIAWHLAHPHNTFIIAEALGPRLVKLFPVVHGSGSLRLVALSLRLAALGLGSLQRSNLETLGA